jgi:hypothetical protein
MNAQGNSQAGTKASEYSRQKRQSQFRLQVTELLLFQAEA